MRKYVILFLLCFLCTDFIYASTPVISKAPFPLPHALYKMPLKELVKLKHKDIIVITGKPLNMEQRFAMSFMRGAMKKAIRSNPDISAGEFLANKRKMKGWLLVLLIILGVMLLAFIIFAIAYGAGQE